MQCRGVACFVKDNAKRSYNIRLYNLKDFSLVSDQKCHLRFEYLTPQPYYHTYSSDSYLVGLNFSSKDEAEYFNKAVQEKLKERNRKLNERNRKLSKKDIGDPTNFVHKNHMGRNLTENIDKLDPAFENLFEQVGISKNQLEDEETRDFIYDFIERRGGVEAVKKEHSRRPLPPTPPTSKPQGSPSVPRRGRLHTDSELPPPVPERVPNIKPRNRSKSLASIMSEEHSNSPMVRRPLPPTPRPPKEAQTKHQRFSRPLPPTPLVGSKVELRKQRRGSLPLPYPGEHSNNSHRNKPLPIPESPGPPLSNAPPPPITPVPDYEDNPDIPPPFPPPLPPSDLDTPPPFPPPLPPSDLDTPPPFLPPPPPSAVKSPHPQPPPLPPSAVGAGIHNDTGKCVSLRSNNLMEDIKKRAGMLKKVELPNSNASDHLDETSIAGALARALRERAGKFNPDEEEDESIYFDDSEWE